jgi:hypothetical protein
MAETKVVIRIVGSKPEGKVVGRPKFRWMGARSKEFCLPRQNREVQWKSTDISVEYITSVFRAEEQTKCSSQILVGSLFELEDMFLRNVN